MHSSARPRLLPAFSRFARGAFVVLLALSGLGVAAPRAGAATYLPGIDVSHYQGTIDWEAVADAGYRFAFAKATEGTTYVDATYATNKAGATRAGLAFGGYHFARPGGTTNRSIQADAVAEAGHYLDVAKLRAGNLLPVLDMESSGGLSISQLQTWTWAYLGEIQRRLHVKAIIYSGPYFWQTYMGDTRAFADAGYKLLWVAHWTSADSPRVQGSNWGGHGWTFWQWTNCAKVPGISGCVDRDWYNGTDLTRAIVPAPPSNVSPPLVTGKAEERSTLTSSTGGWDGTPPFTYTYQWLRCGDSLVGCSDIAGATASTYTLTSEDVGARVAVTVTAANSRARASATSSATDVVQPYDVTPPSVPVLDRAVPFFTTSRSVPLAWSSTDDRSGVGGYDVQYASAAPDGDFGAPHPFVTATTRRSGTFTGNPGRTYCFWADAYDQVGNRSDWSSPRCVVLPVDDRALVASAGWARRELPGDYEGTALVTTSRGAQLTKQLVQVRRIRLVAETCPSCGSVAVRWKGRLLQRFDLTSRTTLHRRQLPVLTLPALQTGNLVIRVVTNNKLVAIDGVSLTRL